MKWVKYRLWSSEIIELPRKHLQQTLWGQRRRSWRKLRPWTWSQTWPASRTCSVLQLKSQINSLRTLSHGLYHQYPSPRPQWAVWGRWCPWRCRGRGPPRPSHSWLVRCASAAIVESLGDGQCYSIKEFGPHNVQLFRTFLGNFYSPAMLWNWLLIKYFIPSSQSHFTQ